MFIPPRSLWVLGGPRGRVTLGTQSLDTAWTRKTITEGTKHYPIKISGLPLARVLLEAAAHSDWYSAVLNMTQSDPNLPFEAFWTWLDKRVPIRYHPDRDTDTTYTEMDIADLETVNDLFASTSDIRELGSNPLLTLKFELKAYV